MDPTAKNQHQDIEDEDDGSGLLGNRSRLVRIPRGADTSIFGGWGVKI